MTTSPWHWVQRTGHLYDPTGKLAGAGVSGHLAGNNNPAMQHVRGVGPLPVGGYAFSLPFTSPHLGPVVMQLTPDETNEMFTRSGFFIHGFSATHYELSSDGCICVQRPLRELLATSTHRRIVVVAEEASLVAGAVG